MTGSPAPAWTEWKRYPSTSVYRRSSLMHPYSPPARQPPTASQISPRNFGTEPQPLPRSRTCADLPSPAKPLYRNGMQTPRLIDGCKRRNIRVMNHRKDGRLARHRQGKGTIERARAELSSHIPRCEVIVATDEQQVAWMDDTLDY